MRWKNGFLLVLFMSVGLLNCTQETFKIDSEMLNSIDPSPTVTGAPTSAPTFSPTPSRSPTPSCTPSPSPSPTVTPTATPIPVSHNVIVSWSANKEKAVNTTGGGYRVFYSQTNNFETSTATYIDVNYISGATSPTTTTLNALTTGVWYLKVMAFSTLGQSGSNKNFSEVSTQTMFTIP